MEEALEFAIKRRLIELSNTRAELLFGRMRPLSSFSAKIELGFALGLYDDNLRRPLNAIRDIRNEFAHNMEATSFDYLEIAKLIRAIRTPSLSGDPSAREIFMMSVDAAMMLLYTAAAADIRIRALGETHTDLFVQVIFAAQAYYQAQASGHTGPPESPGSDKPTPERGG